MLTYETYVEATRHWPQDGRHVLAYHDAERVVVYQAYNDAIADSALASQKFGGGGFSLDRMSWIKTNFLWMMYRSGWATKPGQERILAVTIPKMELLDLLLRAVPSAFNASHFETEDAWRAAVAASDVRLQWDPDHGPDGRPESRRAVQLGLRRRALVRYALELPLRIDDVTTFVREQRTRG